ncbi:MAG: cysteine desulfurase [Isosphaeraceae bacterium]|jgi:selenocysteine lyase/cysteine desulfurase|nr:MAG: cysteine desulfurase [Isosphaeraceae bacterium]
MASRPIDWNAVRQHEFPVGRRWAYFDHAAVSPLPARSAARLRSWVDHQEQNGVVDWPVWERRLEPLRADLANMIGASVEEIALTTSTTLGLGLVAEGFPWRAGDVVVTAADEYPSNLYPWMNLADRGVEVRRVAGRDGRVVLDDLVRAIDGRTRLVTISHVQFASGFRVDLAGLGAVCRERGIALCVDAIQGLGPLRIDVEAVGIDFLAADGHKWLLGPEGAGFLYVRRSWLERMRVVGVGWHSVVGTYNDPDASFVLKPTAQRWEGGSYAMPGMQAFAASVGLIRELGESVVSERILQQAERCRELARRWGWSVYGPKSPSEESGIVVIEKPGVDPARFVAAAREAGVVICARRGRVRLSPHVYNDDEDYERLERLLREGPACGAGPEVGRAARS